MSRFVCLYAGPTRETARLVATVSDARAVNTVARAALRALAATEDPVLRRLTDGRREALQEIIAGEGKKT